MPQWIGMIPLYSTPRDCIVYWNVLAISLYSHIKVVCTLLLSSSWSLQMETGWVGYVSVAAPALWSTPRSPCWGRGDKWPWWVYRRSRCTWRTCCKTWVRNVCTCTGLGVACETPTSASWYWSRTQLFPEVSIRRLMFGQRLSSFNLKLFTSDCTKDCLKSIFLCATESGWLYKCQ